MRLIFVHGIAQHGKNPDQLKQLWYEVLQDNLQLSGTALPADLEIGFPFYGDVLFDLTAQLAQPQPLDVKLKGSERSLVNTDRRARVGTGFQCWNFPTADRGSVAAKCPREGSLQWEWMHSVLSVLDRSVLIGDITLQKATAEVYAYLNYPVSEAVDAILSTAFVGNGPCVIVAHSLGTVVTYRVLTALAGAVDVKSAHHTWLTTWLERHPSQVANSSRHAPPCDEVAERVR
ncbi:MAG: hypothetical protein R3E42_16075 [Burkholderiaceae bacterium]